LGSAKILAANASTLHHIDLSIDLMPLQPTDLLFHSRKNVAFFTLKNAAAAAEF
jgi:hypothetical protein